MKTLKLGLATVGIMMSFALPQTALADDTAAAPQAVAQKKEHHHGKKGFFLGVCVGQTLAAQGIQLKPGQHDDATKAAIHAAKESCVAKFKAAHSSHEE